jgi:hypothetical protein
VSEAVATPAEEVRDHVADQPIKHTDATGWKQGGEARTLWTIATTMATAFFITKILPHPSLSGRALRGQAPPLLINTAP